MPAAFKDIVIFLIYGQLKAIQKPDSRRIVCKAYIFNNSNPYFTKTENRTKKSLTQLSHYYFEKRYYFCQKMLILCKENAESLGNKR